MQMYVEVQPMKRGVVGLQIETTSENRRSPYPWSSYLSSNPIQFHIPDYGQESCNAPQLTQEAFAGGSTPDVEKGLHEAQLGMSDQRKLDWNKT